MLLENILFFRYYPWPYLPHPLFRYTIKPSKKTLSFLSKILKDRYFQNKITEIRTKYGIPKKGYRATLLKKYKDPVVTKLGRFKQGTYDIQPLWNQMKDESWAIAEHYGLNSIYGFFFFLLITHNAFLESSPQDHIDIQYYSGKDHIESIVKFHKDPIAALIIKTHVTKQQLKHWIDDNWYPEVGGNLNYIMPKLPKEKGTYINANLDEEIFLMKQEGKTYKQIADELIQKYPNNDNVYDSAWLKVRYSRYKNTFKGITLTYA